MKTSPTSLLITTAACLASVALFAQNGTHQDTATTTAPVVLPTVEVKGDTTVEPAPDKNTTEKQAAALALKRYLFQSETDRALNRFTLPVFGRTPEQRALVRLREDQRLERLATLEDRIAYLKLTDPAAAQRLRQETYSLALRDDYLPASMTLAATR